MSVKKLKLQPLAIWMIIIPMVISIIYFSLFASNRYVSNAQIVVRQAESGQQASMPGLALLMGSADPASREYTLYLREHILSHDMLLYLEDVADWTEHYSRHILDPLY